MAEKFKDIFFKESFIDNLSDAIIGVFPTFDRITFKKDVFHRNWKQFELKEKMHHITRVLHNYLPRNYEKAIDILLKIAPDFQGFDSLIFPDFVEYYGISYPEISIPALEVFTKCCTSEFAIRPFIDKYEDTAMKYMHKWAEDNDEKVRRLASEGCRPRLPWGKKVERLITNPEIIISILKKLKDDNSEDVRRSVSNNLNDISKDHPDIVLDLCEKWYGENTNTDKLVKHACRSLLKNGNKRAMSIFGFIDTDKIEIQNINISNNNPVIGEKLLINFTLINKEDNKKIRIEYVVHYKTKSNIVSKKVYQIKEAVFQGGNHEIKKTHAFLDNSTRKHYPGEHTIAIIINGVVKEKIMFNLNMN